MRLLLAGVLWAVAASAMAQQRTDYATDRQRMAEDLYGLPDDGAMNEEQYENMQQLLAHPLDLNKASVESLRLLRLLTEAQLKNLADYRAAHGPLLSVYELQAVPGFDLESIYGILPFVTVRDPSAQLNTALLGRMRTDGDAYFLVRHERSLQTKAGFRAQAAPEQRFGGSPDKLTLRLRSARPGDFSVGFTAEKDAGEALRWAPGDRHYGFDYLSAHVQVLNKGRIENLVVGDYQCQFGQGILLGGTATAGKGGETITSVRRSTLGIVPYTSAYEAGALRGAAATVRASRRVSVTGFFSHIRRDGNRAEDEQGRSIITSLPTTGLHRSESEAADRYTVREANAGAVVRYVRNGTDAGVMYNAIAFSERMQPEPSVYNRFLFRGTRSNNIGMFFNYTRRNVTFFSEWAYTLQQGTAHVAGILCSLSPHLDVSVLHRRYARDVHTFFSNAFAEGSTAQNESGVYGGWHYRFNRRFALSGYVDVFRFPWLRFRVYAPSQGHEWLLRASYQPTRAITLLVQAREETKARNVQHADNVYHTANGTKRSFWFSCTAPVTRTVTLRTRVQGSNFTLQGRTTAGMALAQNMRVDLGKVKLTANYTLFHTDDFDNRQYLFDADVWLAYSLPAYAGAGVRSYLLAEYDLGRHITLWLRYARFRYTDRQTIGSGVDAIEGSIQSDVKAQVRVRF